MYIALTICWYHALKINVSENRKGNKKNGQSREIGNIGYTRNKMKTKKNHNTCMCWTPLFANKHK